jgi:hypothetical protein
MSSTEEEKEEEDRMALSPLSQLLVKGDGEEFDARGEDLGLRELLLHIPIKQPVETEVFRWKVPDWSDQLRTSQTDSCLFSDKLS